LYLKYLITNQLLKNHIVQRKLYLELKPIWLEIYFQMVQLIMNIKM
jgi:hypothetical protein